LRSASGTKGPKVWRRKVYQILPDAHAAKDKHVRVIDESGEDYLYPADYFVPLTLPREVERALSVPTR
jgi:hypothetical protein